MPRLLIVEDEEVLARNLAKAFGGRGIDCGTRAGRDGDQGGGGSGKVRFRTRPRSARDLPLGCDPRDATVVVRSATGDDVLATTFPDDDPTDDGDVVCLLAAMLGSR